MSPGGNAPRTTASATSSGVAARSAWTVCYLRMQRLRSYTALIVAAVRITVTTTGRAMASHPTSTATSMASTLVPCHKPGGSTQGFRYHE